MNIDDRFPDLLGTDQNGSEVRFSKELYENKLSAEQTSELDVLIGMLSSAIFYSATKAGMKLGARITAELIK